MTGALPHFDVIFRLKVKKHWKEKSKQISTILNLHSHAHYVIAVIRHFMVTAPIRLVRTKETLFDDEGSNF